MTEEQVRLWVKVEVEQALADVKDLQGEFSGLAAEAQKTIPPAKDLKDGAADLAKEMKGSAAEAGGLAGQLGALAQAALQAGALREMVRAAQSSVLAFADAEAASQRLDAALRVQGAEEAGDSLRALADELQHVAGVDGDLVVQLEAELVAQGKTVEQTKKTIQAAAALSSMTGDDLSASVAKLQATFSGMAGQVGRMIPEIKDLTEAQLQSGAAVDIVFEKYSSFIGQTGSTEIALNSAKASFGDLQEALGEGLAPIIREGALVVRGLASAIANLPGPIKTAAGIMTTVLITAFAALTIRTGILTASNIGLFGAQQAVNASMAVMNPLLWAGIAAAGALAVSVGLLVAAKQREARAISDSSEATDKATQSYASAAEAASAYRDTIRDLADAEIERKIIGLKREQEDAQALLDKMSEQFGVTRRPTRDQRAELAAMKTRVEVVTAEIEESKAEILANQEERRAVVEESYKKGADAIRGVIDNAKTESEKIAEQIAYFRSFDWGAGSEGNKKRDQAIGILEGKKQAIIDEAQEAISDFEAKMAQAPISHADQRLAVMRSAYEDLEDNLREIDKLAKQAGLSELETASLRSKALAVYNAKRNANEDEFAFKARELQASLTESALDDLTVERDRTLASFTGTSDQKLLLEKQYAKKMADARIAEDLRAFEEWKKMAAQKGDVPAMIGAEIQTQAADTDIGKMLGFAGQEDVSFLQILIGSLVQLLLGFESVQEVFNFVQTLVGEMKPMLDPAMEQALRPLLETLGELARPLAMILVPVLTLVGLMFRLNWAFKATEIGAQVIADAFIWLNDKAFVPFGNKIIDLANALIRGVNKVMDDWNLGKYKIREIERLQTTEELAAQTELAAAAQEAIADKMDDVRKDFEERSRALKSAYDDNIQSLGNALRLGVLSESEYASRVMAYTDQYETEQNALELARDEEIESLERLAASIDAEGLSVIGSLEDLSQSVREFAMGLLTTSTPSSGGGMAPGGKTDALQAAARGSGYLVNPYPPRPSASRSAPITYNFPVTVLGSVTTEGDLATRLIDLASRKALRGQWEPA